MHKAQRLHRAEDFAAVFAKGDSRAGAYFRILFRPNGLPWGRWGLIVPKRAESSAVRRNFAKRLIREMMRRRAADFPGLDLVVRVKKPILRQDASSARAELANLLQEVCR